MIKCLVCEKELKGLASCPLNTSLSAGRPAYCILNKLQPVLVPPDWEEVVMAYPITQPSK